ncbi:MAG: hypothetical protein LBD04_09505, partial [Synergistaceae bacterium]|nr:hypothetical protein [Synergistaceae bacterium]
APNITHLFGPSGYKAIFINAVFQSKLYQDSMVMIDTLSEILERDSRSDNFASSFAIAAL